MLTSVFILKFVWIWDFSEVRNRKNKFFFVILALLKKNDTDTDVRFCGENSSNVKFL